MGHRRREEREQAAAEAATPNKRKRPQYWYPDKVSKDEEDAHEQFEHECRATAVRQVKADLMAAVDLVFGHELFAVKADMLQPDQLNQLVLNVSDRVRQERHRERKQRTAASVVAGSM